MGTSGKICIRCGEDCSGKARTKDALGRYMCNECLAAARGARTPSGDAIPLADDPAGILAAAEHQPAGCPGCGLLLPHGTVLCTRCGYNTQTGRALATVTATDGPGPGDPARAGGVLKCVKCGYNLSGLRVPKCPECGTYCGKEERRRAAEKKASAAIRRNEYIKPIVVFAVGVALSIGILAGIGADPERMFAALMIKHAFFVPIGMVIYFMCCVMWLGFDAPLHLIALRLAAAFAVTDIAIIGTGALGVGARIMVPACLMAICLHQLMDHDIPDALIVSVLLTMAQFAIILAIAANMQ